jgi:hypothetical protein
VHVLLYDDIAPARVRAIAVGVGVDQHRRGRGRAFGILGAVHESEQIAFVERSETVDLVDDSCLVCEALGEPLRELEAEIEPVGADVEEEIAGCGRRVMRLAA